MDARLKAPAIITKKGHILSWKQRQFQDIDCQSQGSEMLTEKKKIKPLIKPFSTPETSF